MAQISVSNHLNRQDEDLSVRDGRNWEGFIKFTCSES